VQFEWDAEKARTNLVKHHVSFELAREVWKDSLHIIVPDRFEDGSNDGTRLEWSVQS
jgi:uncharacterized protein